MGGKLSTVKHSRKSVITLKDTPASFAFNYAVDDSFDANWNAALQETSASPSLGHGYLPPRKARNADRITTFHAKYSLSAYIEASKAFANLVVINFTNTWYEPCRRMEQPFKAFAAKYTNVEFAKIDVDELADISRHYRVRTTPTFLFIKKGKEIDKVVGARKEELQRKIEKHY